MIIEKLGPPLYNSQSATCSSVPRVTATIVHDCVCTCMYVRYVQVSL